MAALIRSDWICGTYLLWLEREQFEALERIELAQCVVAVWTALSVAAAVAAACYVAVRSWRGLQGV